MNTGRRTLDMPLSKLNNIMVIKLKKCIMQINKTERGDIFGLLFAVIIIDRYLVC